MTEAHVSGAGGSRSDVPPSSYGARSRRPGNWQRTSPRRVPKVLEISDEERALAALHANPPPGHYLEHAHPLTRIEKYIAASPLVSAQGKGFASVVGAQCNAQRCDTIRLSYSDIARSIKSPRKKTSPTSTATTVDRRTVITHGAELESLSMMQTELRHPVAQRDPAHPKNLHNRFHLVFPPWAGPVAEAQRDVVDEDDDDVDADAARDVDEDDVDETRRADRASIEAEAAGREPPREPAADEQLDDPDEIAAAIAELQARGAGTPIAGAIARAPVELRDRASSPPSPAFVELKTKPPRPSSPSPAKYSAAAASSLPAAELEARATNMREGIAAVLALRPDAFGTLPSDYAERVRKVARRGRLSLATVSIGIEDAGDKANGRSGTALEDFIIGCVKGVRAGCSLSPEAKQIVRRAEADLEAQLEQLRSGARGRGS
ncbi:MAG: hypothetical protein ABJE95_27460 [Byssovorax sp.]